MKHFNNRLSLAAMLAAGLLVPFSASAQKRVMPDGTPVGQTPAKISLEGRKQLATLRQMMQPMGTSIGLGRVGSLEFSPRHAAPVNHMTRSVDAPRGKAYTVVPSHRLSSSYSAACMGVLDLGTGEFNSLYHGMEYSLGEEYNYLTSIIVDDIMYIPEWSQDMITAQVTSGWRRIDIHTGQQLSTIVFGSGNDMIGFSYALAYNEKTKKFYGLGLNLNSSQWGELYEYDLNGDKPTYTYLGNIDNGRSASAEIGFMASLAYNPVDGNLYGIKDNGNMFIVDQKKDPRLSLVYSFDNNADGTEVMAIPDENLPSPLTYSPRDHAFVTIYRNAFDQSMDIVMIDADSYEVVPGNSTSLLGYYSSLNCNEPYAEDEAPAQIELENIQLEGASLSGDLLATTSNETYGGDLISDQKLIVVFSIDGKEISRINADGGQQLTLPFTTTQGMHVFSVKPIFEGGKEGPESRRSVWVGHDNPQAPAGLALSDDNTLTWNKVEGPGAHKGYVDAAAITYDVWVNGQKQNAQPLTETSFKLSFAGSLSRRDITVTATANGMTSDSSLALDKVVGEALTLPVSIAPTQEESSLFNVYDANRDGRAFKFVAETATMPACMGVEMEQNSFTPDDWLFMPKMHFDSADHLYQLAFVYSNFYVTNEKQKSNIKVFIGKQPRPDDMTKLIYQRDADAVMTPLDIEALFSVDEPGDYYIGFYTGLAVESNSRGVRLRDFRVNSLENISVDSPGAPEDVVVAPGEGGEFYASISCKYPTKTIGGQPLDPDTDVTLLATWEDSEAKATGKPGEQCDLRLPINIDGFAFFDLMVVSDGVRINRRTYRVYIGVDQPGRPENVVGIPSRDNLSFHLSWDAPTKGINGGWINPDELTYNIHLRSGIGYSKVGDTRNTTYVYTPYGSDKSQMAIYVGPSAVSRKGESQLNTFAYDYIGRPYEVPMVEEFTQTTSSGFMLKPWTNATNEDFSNCQWNHVTNMMGTGIGDPVLNNGAFVLTSLGGRRGQLLAPKCTTKDTDNARLGLRFWDYPQAGKIEVWGRRYGHEDLELIFTIEPQRPSLAEAQWVDWNEQLPDEYQNCDWIQLNVRGILTSDASSNVLLDNYRVYRDVDHDFRITDLSAPALVSTGETVEFSATVGNSGLEAGASNLIIRLMAGDKILGRQDVPIRRMPAGSSFISYTSWEILPEYAQYGKITFTATIDDDEDEVASNNVKSIDIDVRRNELPIVEDASGEWNDDHSSVALSWQEPAAKYGDWESFEFEDAFILADEIGCWKNVDMDGLPQFAIQNMRWPNDDLSSAWTVYNAEKMKTMNDARFAPHNGKQMLIARSVSFDQTTEKPIQSADWLISPAIVGGTEVAFWLNTGDSQYAETVEVWYSSTDDQLGSEIVQNGTQYTCGSFKRICPFTKSGTDSWEKVSAKLPADAKYFAIVYRSWGQFCAMIDEIEFTPWQLSSWEIDSYNIWRWKRDEASNYELVGDHVKGTSFTDETVGDANASYYITTNVLRNGKKYSGPRSSEVRMFSLGIDDIDALKGIAGGAGQIIATGLEGSVLDIYTADGKYIRSTAITQSRQTVAIESGIYIAKSGNKIAKVVVR